MRFRQTYGQVYVYTMGLSSAIVFLFLINEVFSGQGQTEVMNICDKCDDICDEYM